jgi:hypothetical protein
VTWRGTVLLLLAGILAAALLLATLRTSTRTADAPLLGLEPAEMTGIVIGTGSSTITLENREGVWWITRPMPDRADPARMSRFLESSASLVPLDKIPPPDLKGQLSPEALDLRPPKRSLTFRGKRTHTLLLGKEGATPDRIHARVDSDPSVYLVSAELAALAFAPPDELRDPHPFPSHPGEIEEIDLQQQGGYRELRLRRQGQGWIMESPLRAKADEKALESWAGAFLSPRITRWMPAGTGDAACGLEVPEAVLTVRRRGEEPLRLEIGKEVPGMPGARYARCPGRPGHFVLGGTGEWLGVNPSSLRLRRLAPVELDSVDRIVVTSGGRSVMLSRKPGTGDWICGDRTIPGADVTGWCGRLQEAAASSFETATPDHLAARGIDPRAPGTASLRFVANLSENSAEESAGQMTISEVTVGTPSADGMTALREGNADDLMILPRETVSPLLEEALGWITIPPPAPPSPSSSPTVP